MNYQLTLTPEQMRLTGQALECLARLRGGQLDIAFEIVFPERVWNTYKDGYQDGMKTATSMLKTELFPEISPGGSYGARSREEPLVGEAWTVAETIRHRLAHDDLEEGERPGPYIKFDKPTQWGEGPIPRLIQIEGKSAVEMLVETVNVTGGVTRMPAGGPVADDSWLDLGEAYLQACAELGVEPQYEEQNED